MEIIEKLKNIKTQKYEKSKNLKIRKLDNIIKV